MKEIALSQGQVAVVDDDDFARVAQFKWYAIQRSGKWHAARKPKSGAVYMHRFLMDAPDGAEVDHVNGNGLDNRRENLRICSKRENARNRKSGARAKSSRFHGVTLHPRGNRWRVVICAGARDRRGNAKQIYVGHFIDETEAARAYDRAALKHFGAFAATNFPKEDYS